MNVKENGFAADLVEKFLRYNLNNQINMLIKYRMGVNMQ